VRSKNPKAYSFSIRRHGHLVPAPVSSGASGQFPLYSVYTVDEISIPAVKHAALGQYETRYWSPSLKNPANQKSSWTTARNTARCGLLRSAEYDGILLMIRRCAP